MASNLINVEYEWVVLVMDKHADIIECLNHDKYSEAVKTENSIELPKDYEGGLGTILELQKFEFNIQTHSLEARYNAQLIGAMLPENYDYPEGGKFPKKLQLEIDSYHKKHPYKKPPYRNKVALETYNKPF